MHQLVTTETISWGMTLTAAQINDHHKEGISLNKLGGGAFLAEGLDQPLSGAGGKHIHASRVQVKQGLVEQEMYKEQENSHLGWPDHAKAKKGTVSLKIRLQGLPWWSSD